MTERILSEDTWESSRFLDLPTDACRIAYLRFLTMADDGGEFRASSMRIFRLLSACTDIKTDADAEYIIRVLVNAGLLRRDVVRADQFTVYSAD